MYKTNLPALFPNVFYARYQVWHLSPEEIDQLLANGWQRQARNVITTVSRAVNGRWRPIVMVRINLNGFVWKKRLKKRLRANSKIFDVKIRPFVARNEMDGLWYNYKKNVHGWKRVRPLSEHLFKGLPAASFNTYEIGVFHEGELVAFSIFDKGKKSMASLEAAYDVNYKKHGLGIFTMLLELEYCQKENLEFYYPGFYPKGIPMFDYKLKPGNVEFFDKKNGVWGSWDSFMEKDWMFLEMLAKLRTAQMRLWGCYRCTLKAYNHYAYPERKPSLLHYNFLLELRNPAHLLTNPPFKIAFDPIKERYLLFCEEKLPAYESNATMIHSFHPMILGGQFETVEELENALRRTAATK